MTQVEVLDPRHDARGGYRVDVTRGERIGRVSSEWFSRPADERYLSLSELMAAVKGRADRSRTRTVESAAVRIEASRDNAEALAIVLPHSAEPVAPTHWSFGQLAGLVGAPAAYLRQLPAALAGINLQYGLSSHRAEQVKTLETDDGRIELRAVTGPDYGRIYDHELVAAVQRIAGNGTGDTRWKVPGVLDWSTGVYNPRVDVTADTTTLYASDRDVFLFLVDDLNPIEAGRLPDGSPDLYFRGFYCWNSEVGAKTLGMASFYLRAVCQNRNLWGVEDFEEISIRHSKYAANRFAHQAAVAIASIAEATELFPGEMLGDMIAGYLDGTKTDLWLTASLADEPVAFAFCEPERLTNGTWNLLAIGVRPDRQGCGIGARLVARFEEVLREGGHRILVVDTSGTPEFERTRAFYRSNGFDEQARIREFYDVGTDKVVFWKHL